MPDWPEGPPIDVYDSEGEGEVLPFPARGGGDRVHATTPDGRPYVVKIAGSSVWYVATDAGYCACDANLLRQEIVRHWPTLPVFSGGKKPQPMNAAALFERYGILAENVYYSYSRATKFEYRPPHTGDLYLRVLDTAPPPAVEHPEVIDWLDVLTGDRLGVVCDWLATLPLLDRPTCALVLMGDKSLGKSMIAQGCGGYFGPSIADYDDVFKERFNDALLRSPIVWLDETSEIDSRSGRFRKLLANERHAVEGKGRPTATLIGCPRLIVTSNEDDPLGLSKENLTKASEDAIGERILTVDCQPAAADWLRRRGGRAFTHDWVSRPDGRPGKVAETIAHLVATRTVQHGSRFLVHGDAAEWAARIGSRVGLHATILDALAEYLESEALRRRIGENGGTPPFQFAHEFPRTVLVSNAGLRYHWSALLGASERAPSHNAVARALERLAPTGRIRLGGGDRQWVYPVEMSKLGDRVEGA